MIHRGDVLAVHVYCGNPILFVGVVQSLYIQYKAKFIIPGISHSEVSNQGKYILGSSLIKKSCSPIQVNNFYKYSTVLTYSLFKKSL